MLYINVTEYKNKLLVTELNEDYKLTFKTVDDFKPTIFVETFEDSIYKDLINNKCLQKLDFDSIKDFKNYTYTNKDTNNSQLYGNVSSEYQYIKDNYKENKKYKPLYWFLDIETWVPENGFPNAQEANEPITLIQIKDSLNKTYLFSYLKIYYSTDKNVHFMFFDDETQMLENFIEFNRIKTPAITTAWNGDQFDFPYIINRMKRLNIDYTKISPFGVFEEHRAVMFGKDIKIEKPVGIFWLDYINVYKKADPSGKESWSLEYMSKFVLGDEAGGKLDFKVHGFKNMRDFITMKYNPSLDKNENSKLKQYYNVDNEKFQEEWWSLFCGYGIIDVDVLKKMDDKKGILDMLLNMSHTLGCNTYDVFATIKPWQIHIYNKLYERNLFLPTKTPFEIYHTIGGHVYANPGLHKWVISEDYTSLYPFCMMILNLSPETYINYEDIPFELKEMTKSFYRYNKDDIYCEDIYLALPLEDKLKIKELLKKYNLIMAPNGTFYRKDILGIIPELVKSIFLSRKAYKKVMLKHENNVEQLKKENKDYHLEAELASVANTNQQTSKILINAVYGAIASKTMNISNSDISNAITSFGRLNIKRTTQYVIDEVKKINENFIITVAQMDTDSMYISLDKIVTNYSQGKNLSIEEITEFCDKFVKNIIQPIIDKSSTEIFEWFNAYENTLQMDREIIADSMISVAKKRYTCRIWDNEGVRLTKPKKKITGLEIKRSDTPTNVRIVLDKVIDLMFENNNDKLIDFIDKYKNEHYNLSIDDIAIPSGISDITKFETGNINSIPMHVRASMNFNSLIQKNNLKQFSRINNGDKIKYIFLKRNPIINQDVIAWNDVEFLKVIGLDKYIDYDRLFKRTFLSPVETLTDAINWKTNKNSAMMDLF